MDGDGKKSPDSKAELITRLNALLHRVLEEKEESSSAAQKFLNSPFFVTLVGGIVLAALTAFSGWMVQYVLSEQAEARQIAERNERLAHDFAKEFPMALNLAARLKGRELWMDQPASRKGDARYRDGRSFTETRDHYERLVDQYQALKPTASFCNQIIASFTNRSVNLLAQALTSNVDALLNSTDTAQVEVAFSLASSNYQKLTLEIFSELNKVKPTESKEQNEGKTKR